MARQRPISIEEFHPKNIFPTAEFYDFCKKSKIDYKRWMEKPEDAVIDLGAFKTALVAEKTKPEDTKNPPSQEKKFNDIEKTKLDNQIKAIDNFLEAMGDHPSKDQIEKIVTRLDYHEKNSSTFAEKREEIGKDVIIENVYKTWDSTKELVGKYPLPSIIVGVAMLWLLKDRLETPTGKIAVAGILTTVGWLGFSKIAESASKGKTTLGREALGNYLGSIGKGPENYTQLYEQIGLNNDYGKEVAAVCDVPTKTLIELYKKARKPGEEKKINLKDPLLSGYLDSKKLKTLNGDNLYKCLDDLFNKDYEDTMGRTHRRGDLILAYEHSDLSFGNFLLSLSRIDDPSLEPLGEKVEKALIKFHNASVDFLSETVAKTALRGVVVSVGIIMFPIEVAGKSLVNLLYDTKNGKWRWKGESSEFDDPKQALAVKIQ